MLTSFVSLQELRQAAEKELSAKQAGIPPAEDLDQAKLVHALQVQQIEREMQSQALTKTFAKVDALRATYQDFYDMAPVGYLTLALSGEILALNRRAAKFLGLKKQTLPEQILREFFDAASLASLDACLSEVQTTSAEVFAQSLLIRRRPQMPLYVNLQAWASRDTVTDEATIRLAMTDVSALKMAKEDVIRVLDGVASHAVD